MSKWSTTGNIKMCTSEPGKNKENTWIVLEPMNWSTKELYTL